MSWPTFASTNINLMSKFNFNKAWWFFVGDYFWVLFSLVRKVLSVLSKTYLFWIPGTKSCLSYPDLLIADTVSCYIMATYNRYKLILSIKNVSCFADHASFILVTRDF